MSVDDWIEAKKITPPKNKPFLCFSKDQLNEEDIIVVTIWWEGGETEDGYSFMEGFYILGEWGKPNFEWDCDPIYWMQLPLPPRKNERT